MSSKGHPTEPSDSTECHNFVHKSMNSSVFLVPSSSQTNFDEEAANCRSAPLFTSRSGGLHQSVVEESDELCAQGLNDSVVSESNELSPEGLNESVTEELMELSSDGLHESIVEESRQISSAGNDRPFVEESEDSSSDPH